MAGPLVGRRILVVEDEYMIADDLTCELAQAGAEVVGPAGSLPQAVALLKQAEPLDAAVLDVNLRELLAFPLIDELLERQVKVLICTGYDDAMIPERYRGLPRCEKPVLPRKLLAALLECLGGPNPTIKPAMPLRR